MATIEASLAPMHITFPWLISFSFKISRTSTECKHSAVSRSKTNSFTFETTPSVRMKKYLSVKVVVKDMDLGHPGYRKLVLRTFLSVALIRPQTRSFLINPRTYRMFSCR